MPSRKKKEPITPAVPPVIIDRTPEQQRFALRKAVHYFYDIQRLRLQTNGRLTKGTNLHPADVEHFERRVAELELTEANALDDIRAHLKTIPFYVKVLSGGGVKPNPYKGIGPTMAGVILAEFDITREETASQMWSFCMPPGEPILSDAGLSVVEDITEGMHVYDRDGRITEVTKVGAREFKGAMLSIKAVKLPWIHATEDHPVLVARRDTAGEFKESYIRADEIKEGDYLVTPRLVDTVPPPRELDLTKYVRQTWKLPVSGVPINEDTVKFFGRYVADGHATLFTQHGYERGRACITFGRHKSMEEYHQIVVEHFKCPVYVKERQDSNQFYFGRMAIAKLFRDEFGVGSENKRVPQWVMDGPQWVAQSFLSGYMEGDGCEVKTGPSAGARWANSVSAALIRQLQMLATKLDDLPGVSFTKRAGSTMTIEGRTYKQRDRWNLFFAPKGNIDASSGVHRQDGRWLLHVKEVRSRKYSGTVHSISTASESFLLGAAVVHNCGLAPIPAVRCKACSGLVVGDTTRPDPLTVYQHVSKELGKKCTAGDGLSPSQTFASGKSMHPTKGEKLPYNKFLKSKLVGVLGDVLLRCNSPWRKFYDDYKQRKTSARWGTSDMHRHRAAIRYMVKMLLLDIWREWRTFEKLPVREPYAVEYLGKVHHGGAAPGSPTRAIAAPESPRADQEAERDAEVEAELKRASGE